MPSKRQVSETPETKRAKVPNEGLRERLAIFESEAAQSAAEKDEAQRIAHATVASIQSEEEELRISRQAEARVSVLVSEMSADSARKGTERAQKAAAEHQEMVHLVEQARRERDQAVSAADRAVSDAATPLLLPREQGPHAQTTPIGIGGARNLFALPLGEDLLDQTCSCSRILKA